MRQEAALRGGFSVEAIGWTLGYQWILMGSQLTPGRLQSNGPSFQRTVLCFPAKTGRVANLEANPGEVTRMSYAPSGKVSLKSPFSSVWASSLTSSSGGSVLRTKMLAPRMIAPVPSATWQLSCPVFVSCDGRTMQLSMPAHVIAMRRQ